jgi:hypothetical protein
MFVDVFCFQLLEPRSVFSFRLRDSDGGDLAACGVAVVWIYSFGSADCTPGLRELATS